MTEFEKIQMSALIKKTLASKGGQYPNPVVGARIIKNDRVIGEGIHQYAGEPHAEVLAIQNATEVIQGSTLLITMEPCVHYGKTPPCVDAIVSEKFAKVIWAMDDPNPIVSGKAITILKSHGINVEANVSHEAAMDCIKEFAMAHRYNRPYVYVKAAISIDSKLAPDRQKRFVMSCNQSLHRVQQLRQYCQAIVVGWCTITIDQPRLRSTLLNDDQQPWIVIVDPRCQTDHIWLRKTLDSGRRVMLFSHNAHSMSHPRFKSVFSLPFDKSTAWVFIMQTLHAEGCHGVLVEGGAGVLSSIIQSSCFDELWLFKTPHVFASSDSVSMVNNGKYWTSLELVSSETIDQDVLIQYKNKRAFSI